MKTIELFEKKLERRNLAKFEFPDSGLNTAAGHQFSQGQMKAASAIPGSQAHGGEKVQALISDENMDRFGVKVATAIMMTLMQGFSGAGS